MTELTSQKERPFQADHFSLLKLSKRSKNTKVMTFGVTCFCTADDFAWLKRLRFHLVISSFIDSVEKLGHCWILERCILGGISEWQAILCFSGTIVAVVVSREFLRGVK